MAIRNHVTNIVLAMQTESGLRTGAQLGILADADLATSEAVVLAAVDTKTALKHVTVRQLKFGVKKAVELVSDIKGSETLITGGSLANIYADAQFPNDVGIGMTPIA